VYDDPFNGPFRGFSFGRDGFERFDFPAASDTFPWTINNAGMQGGVFFDPKFGSDGYAISAEIPVLPFRIRESAARVIPRCFAALVTDTFSRYSLNTIPGWGGLNILIKSPQ
jgi:hypothetical protein